MRSFLCAARIGWTICLVPLISVGVQAQDLNSKSNVSVEAHKASPTVTSRLNTSETTVTPARAAERPPLPNEVASSDLHTSPADKSRAVALLASLPATFEPNRGQAEPSVKFLSRGPGDSLFLTHSGAFLTIAQPSDSSAGQPAANRFSLLELKFIGANRHSSIEGLALQPNRSNYFLGNRADQQHSDVPNYARVRYSSIYPGIDLVFHGDPSHLEFDLDLAPGTDPRRIRFRLNGAKRLALDSSGDLIAKVGSAEFRLHRPVAFQPANGGERAVAAEFVLSSNDEIGFRLGAFDPSLPLTIDPVLSYASFLGGSGADTAFAVALDPQHNFYVSGETASSNFPISAGVQGIFGGASDAFVLKIKSDGSGLVYSTFLGGNLTDASQALAVDSLGNAYVTGFTTSLNFPAVNALQPVLAGGQDVFVTKVSPDGASLIFSTYLGGTGLDTIAAIALDSSNNIVLAGTTKSRDFPVVNALEPTLTGAAGNSDAFVAKLKADGSALLFSTYFGGTGVDGATGVAVSSTGNIWVAGGTGSADFPVVNGLQSTFGGGGVTNVATGDAFLAEFKPDGSALLFSTFWGGSGQEQATTLSLDANDNVFLVGITNSTNFPTHLALQPQLATTTGFNAFVTKFSADGSSAPFSTYFGGSGSELAFGAATDSSGNIFISGSTSSTNLPLANAIQSSYLGGATDGFVSQLSADGSALLFSTYLGGTGADSFNRIAVDSSGVYVVGSSDSSDFPTMGTLVNTFGGATDGVIVRLAGFTAAPDLALSKTHTANLIAGTDGSYTLAVSNVGNGATTSAITVTDTLPTGLTYSSASGNNWSCDGASQTVTCTNPGSIAAGAKSSFTINVHVAANAPSSVTNTASVSVAGDTNSSNNSASDVASITAPPAIMISFGSSTIGLNTSTSLTFTLNNARGIDLNGVAFSDTLPAGLVVSTPNGLSSTCSGTATASAASSSVALTGATLAAGATCTVAVNVTATTVGVFSDSASVTSTNGGSGNTSSASLTVIAPFRLASSFNPSSILVTGVSTLSFTLTNPNASVPLSSKVFTEALPAGLVFGSNVLATSTSTCSAGIATASADGTSITAGGFTLSAGASCTFTVQVTGTTTGTFTNSVSLDSTLAGPSNTSTATITVNKPAPFRLASTFNPSSILVTGVSTLSFTLTNPNASVPLSSKVFTEALPAGLVFGSNVLATSTSTCSAGIATASADGTSITAGGFTLSAGASCTFTVQVTGTTTGTFTNSVSLDSTLAGPSNTSTVTITVTSSTLAASVSPSSLTFAAQLVGSLSAPQSVTLKNTGSVSLAITDSSTSGDFSETNTCGSTLAASASCTFTVAFTPTAAGARSGVLTISDNATGSPQTVTLTGSGADFTLGPVSGSTLSATVKRGQTATYNLSVAPTGGLTGTISFSCSGAPSESTCTVSPVSLATNGTAATSFSVNVSTTAPAAMLPLSVQRLPGDPMRPAPAPFTLVACCFALISLGTLIFVATRFSRIRIALTDSLAHLPRRTLALAASVALFFALVTATMSLAGCASSSVNTPPDPGTLVGSDNLIVTATFTSGSSTLKHTLALTLNVQ